MENNVAETLGGGFQVTYKYRDYKSAEFHIKIDNEDNQKSHLYKQRQRNCETDILYGTGSTRYRMQYN